MDEFRPLHEEFEKLGKLARFGIGVGILLYLIIVIGIILLIFAAAFFILHTGVHLF